MRAVKSEFSLRHALWALSASSWHAPNFWRTLCMYNFCHASPLLTTIVAEMAYRRLGCILLYFVIGNDLHFLFSSYTCFCRLLSSGFLVHFLLLVMDGLGFSHDNIVEDLFSSLGICHDLLVQSQEYWVLGLSINSSNIDSYPRFSYFSKSKHDRIFIERFSIEKAPWWFGLVEPFGMEQSGSWHRSRREREGRWSRRMLPAMMDTRPGCS